MTTLSRVASRSVSYVTLIVIAIVGIFPIAYLFLLSTKRRIDIGDVPPSLKIEWSVVVENYKEVLFERSYVSSTINTLIITSVVVILSLLIGTPAAYTLSRLKIKGSERISTTILSLRFMPPVAVAVMIPLFKLQEAEMLLTASNSPDALLITAVVFLIQPLASFTNTK